MRLPDHDRERSEKERSLPEFLEFYNKNLPASFPRASLPLLKEFQKDYPSLFKSADVWTLDIHRKKVMDWLPRRLKVS
jgi:hypothetical protein